MTEARLHEVADELRGQCVRGLEDVATEEERRDTKFLEALDDLVILCDTCGWWVDADEMEDDQCEDCRES